jgi:glycosyltransferase involved in cell wall biosynthesis
MTVSKHNTMPPGGEQRIRIAFVIDKLFIPAGGTEGQLLQLVEKIDRERFDLTVVCLESTEWVEHQFDLAPLTVLGIRLSPHPRVLQQIWSFSRLLRQKNYDIVQTYFRDANIVGILAASLAGVDVIVSARRGIAIWNNQADLLFLKWLNRRVTRFVANSRATRDRYSRVEGIEKERMEVIYNGLDPARFRARGETSRNAVREEIGLPPEAPVVGMVANLRREKGIEDFVQAAALVIASHPEARFLIIGSGPEAAQLKELSHSLQIHERVLFLGKRSDVPDLLGLFDVGVLASHSESFSNSILEYLAAGLPVVATDIGGAREAVRDGVDGFIVPSRHPAKMAEKIHLLLSQPGGARSWRKDTEIRSIFHTDAMVRAYEELYARLVKEARER